jgi:sulfur carrier protein
VIVLNGRASELVPGDTVIAALRILDLEPDARGIAVAVDGEVVPRADWASFSFVEEARVEVLTAMQGG